MAGPFRDGMGGKQERRIAARRQDSVAMAQIVSREITTAVVRIDDNENCSHFDFCPKSGQRRPCCLSAGPRRYHEFPSSIDQTNPRRSNNSYSSANPLIRGATFLDGVIWSTGRSGIGRRCCGRPGRMPVALPPQVATVCRKLRERQVSDRHAGFDLVHKGK
jgi:hypothetical protein